MKNILIIIVASFLTSMIVSAQDVHMSQYDANPVILNPSLTGMKNDLSYRIIQQYRNQWDALVRKSYLSSSISYDMPIEEKWGVGGYVLNDNSNRLFNSFNFVLAGAHDITIGSQDIHHLCVGIHAGFIHKKMRTNSFTFDSQYNNGIFDSDIPSGEIFERETRFMPEVNIGFSYVNNNTNSNYRPHGGIAVSHLTHPKSNFLAEGDVTRLPLRYLLHGGCFIDINENFMLEPITMFMVQRKAYEINAGLRAYNYIHDLGMTIISGVNYRHKDAIIPNVGVIYNSFIYRVSYDFTISPISKFNRYRGGLEFSLTFYKTISKGASSFSGL